MGTFLRKVANITLPVLLLAGGLFFVSAHDSLAQSEISTSTPGSISTTTTPADTAPASPTPAPTPTPAGDGISKCGDWSLGGSAVCIINFATFTVLGIANFLLGITGSLLNWVVVKTVFQFGSLIGNSPGLLIAWGIFRDLGNMLLLFGFIFMGLATILDMGTFSAKKALPPLILFAILMNFSLFAAEAIIDTSNALTSALYSQANTDECFNGTTADASVTGSATEDCGLNYGIAGHIMQSTGLSSMFNRPPTSVGNEAVISIGLTLFSTIGAVVLLATSIMLIARVVTLSFLMVAAPIGFAGMAIPPLRGLAERWWKTLISQSFFAPVLFLLIFVSLKISDSFSGSTADRGLAAALSNPSSSVLGIVMIFVIVIGFLIASLVVAKSMGATGATFAISTAKKAATGTFGTVGGFAGRNTIGKGGQYAQKRYEAWMGKDKDSQSRKGKFARSILTNTKLDDALAGTFSAAQNAKFGSGKSLKEDQDHHKARKEVFDKAGRKAANQRAVSAATTPSEMAKILNSMSETERAELDEVKKGTGKLALLAESLSPQAFKKMMADKDIPQARKDQMRVARYKDAAATIRDAEANPGDKAKQDAARVVINGMSKIDIGELAQAGIDPTNPGSGALSQIISSNTFAGLMSDDQAKKMKDIDELSADQQANFATNRKNTMSNPTYIAPSIPTMAIDDINKLDPAVLTSPQVQRAIAARIPSLGGDDINKLKGAALASTVVLNAMDGTQLSMIEPGKLTSGDRTFVVRHIENKVITSTPEGNQFQAHMTLDPKIKARWAPYGL